MSWFRRFSNLFRRDKLSSELEEELQFHIDARARDNIRSGMSADAARSDARKRFGSRALAKEGTHEANILVPLETIGQDVRYALRSLRKSPGFTAVAILTLALGMGATTAIFTIVNGVLLRPLPFSEPERLFLISCKMPGVHFDNGLYDGDYLEFRRHNQAFENVTTFGENSLGLTGAGDPVRVPVAMVTASFFPVLRANPAIGRAFLDKDEQDGRVVLLSDRLWRTRFNADPGILGKTITLDGNGHQVIGVMPAGFAFPAEAEAWLPLAVQTSSHNTFYRPVIGRLRPGPSPQQAQAELEAFAQHLPPAGNGRNRKAQTARLLPLKDLLVGEIRKSLLIFMGAVGFVLLIACANVANLLLMKGASRRQEIALRTALGARRGRLIRQLLTESLLLSIGGAAAGIVLAMAGVPALLALAPEGRVPRIDEIHFDGWVIVVALGLGTLTGIVFGLMPAFQATGRGLLDFLGQSGRSFTGRREALRSALVVSEIALALVLLTGAGLMLRSFLNMRAVNTGFRADNTLTMTVDLPDSVYRTAASSRDFHTRILAKLADVPGVSAAGSVNWLPMNRALVSGDFHIEGGRPLPRGYMVDKPAASPEYFRAMGIRLLSGRTFSERDAYDAPGVAILSQSVARDLWPSEDPVGKRITLEDNPDARDWLTIVGVVDDVRQHNLTDQPDRAIYQPYQQVGRPFFLSHMTFVVRTTASSASAAAAMRGVLRDVDRNLPVQSIASMIDLVSTTTAEPLFQARLILIFSMLALLLSAIGIYGVLAYSITERTREIGIRMALGAERSDITQMILKRSLLLATAGVVVGVAGALAVTRVLAKFLFDVKPTDPATFLAVVAMLVAVALLAGLVPARRATKVDPLVALRCE